MGNLEQKPSKDNQELKPVDDTGSENVGGGKIDGWGQNDYKKNSLIPTWFVIAVIVIILGVLAVNILT